MTRSYTGPQFEDEVRNIARSLYSNSMGQGSQMVNGRERDGVFWNGEFYTVIEATTEKAKAKALTDGKKTHDLVAGLRKENYMARGILVTLHEPTTDQKEVVKKFSKTTKIISFDELRSLLFDAQSYLNNRAKRRFGSVYDHVDHSHEIPLNDFVEPTIEFQESSEATSVKGLTESLMAGGRTVLIAEYGVGKSMVLRHMFFNLVAEFRAKRHFRTPVAINLRDHLGQTDPIELLERHARANAADPQKLVAAWNAGYIDLLIDGFDELSTRGWTGDVKRLREYRRSSHAVVRRLIKDTPKKSGILITGRDAYFDSLTEMREALAAPVGQFGILRVHPFDEVQANSFLKKKNYHGAIPDWIPTRPLLLTYLVTKGLLLTAVEAQYEGVFPRGAAWLSLIDMIASREGEQSEGVDKNALLEFLGALSVISRQASDAQVSFSPQQMESVFFNLTGTTIIEDERNILLRLPGLGAAQDSPLNRSFVDFDFLNACCAIPTLKFILDPYSDYSKTYGFGGLATPMSDVGIEALATLCEHRNVVCGQITAATDHAITHGLHQLAFDVFRVAIRICAIDNSITFDGIEVKDVDLSLEYFDGIHVDFSGCLIEKIVLPDPADTNKDIVFTESLIGTIEGRVSEADLSKNQFIDCEISSFSDEYSVNSEVLGTNLPLGVRVMVVTLRKVFKQYGSSRLESALVRGLDQRSRMLVPDVISLLVKHGFIVPTGRKGKVTYAGTKAKRSEALKIIQSPNTARSLLVRECSSLS